MLRAAQREHAQPFPHRRQPRHRLAAAGRPATRRPPPCSRRCGWPPASCQKAEEYQLKLVRLRAASSKDSQDLDDLFGVRYVGDERQVRAGQAGRRRSQEAAGRRGGDGAAAGPVAAGRRPAAVATGELANAHGDVRTAAAIMDGCVTEFGLHAASCAATARLTRAAADELAKTDPDGVKAAHEGHAGGLKPRSRRPLREQARRSRPAADQRHRRQHPALERARARPPWTASTSRPSRKYLKELDGKQVALTGFMQPLGEELEVGAFMLIEYPVGCWYCEMPEMTGIVLVELPAGKTTDVHARPGQDHRQADAERHRPGELPVHGQQGEGVRSRLE